MTSRKRRAHAVVEASFVVTLLAAAPSTARAGEVQLATSSGAFASSWRGDAGFGQTLRLGYRMADLVSVDASGRLGYATVDERLVTQVSVGGTLYGRIRRVRPYVRLALVHQHEEPMPAVREDAFGALFGVGDGIRHRGGFGGALGFDVPVHEGKSTELVVGLDTNASWFPDPRGPAVYAGGAVWLGVNFGL